MNEAALTLNSGERASSVVSFEGKDDGCRIPTSRLTLLSLSPCFGLFLSLVDTSIVATALFTIGSDFDSLTQATWVALAYMLAYLGCAVMFASVGNVIGRKIAYLVALLIFTAFSLGAGFASSLKQLIALRAIQGVGGSGLYSLTMIIFPEIYPIEKVKYVAGLVGAVIAVGGVLGPVLGGVITHLTTWRWIFWLNGPFGLLSMALFWICWPRANQLRPQQRQKYTELDFLGSLLLVAASVLFVFAFQQGGLATGAWSTALVIVPLVVGCFCALFFFGWEMLISRFWPTSVNPIFPIRLLQNRVYVGGILTTLLFGFVFFLVIFSLPLRFQVVNGKSPLAAGLGLLPLLGSAAIGSFIAGAASSKRNNTFYTFFASACLSIIGTGLLSTLPCRETIETTAYGYQVFIGLGFGLSAATVGILTTLETDLRDAAVSQGIIAQARVLGGSLGIAASTAIVGSTQRRELFGVVSQAQLSSLPSSASSLTPDQLQAVRQAYCNAFSKDLHIYSVIAGITVLTVLLTFRRHSVGVKERRKEQIQEDDKRVRDAAVPPAVECVKWVMSMAGFVNKSWLRRLGEQ